MSKAEPPAGQVPSKGQSISEPLGALEGTPVRNISAAQVGKHLTVKAFAVSFFGSLLLSGVVLVGSYYGAGVSLETLKYIGAGMGATTLVVTAGATGYYSGKEAVQRGGVEAQEWDFLIQSQKQVELLKVERDELNMIEYRIKLGSYIRNALDCGAKLERRRSQRNQEGFEMEPDIIQILLDGDALYLDISNMTSSQRREWDLRNNFAFPIPQIAKKLLIFDAQPQPLKFGQQILDYVKETQCQVGVRMNNEIIILDDPRTLTKAFGLFIGEELVLIDGDNVISIPNDETVINKLRDERLKRQYPHSRDVSKISAAEEKTRAARAKLTEVQNKVHSTSAEIQSASINLTHAEKSARMNLTQAEREEAVAKGARDIEFLKDALVWDMVGNRETSIIVTALDGTVTRFLSSDFNNFIASPDDQVFLDISNVPEATRARYPKNDVVRLVFNVDLGLYEIANEV